MVRGKKYQHKEVEPKWQEKWGKAKTYVLQLSSPKNKFYNLMMFPYPSAEGLHAGNVFAFTGSDVYGRFKRLQGYDVFEPIGLDGFGIHSENYAIKSGRSPQEHAERSQENFYKQLRTIGNGFDWTRTLETYDPNYYKWTQWLFVELFKAGLAYRKEADVNWCPSCKTVLADEQVMTPRAAGKLPKQFKSYDEVPDAIMVCERCGTIVVRKKLEQWFFKITEYANRLLDNLETIKWTEKVKIVQRNWISKKEGINITYKIKDSTESITVWTSRPETNFGATFVVLSPQNLLIERLTTADNKKSVSDYIKESQKRSEEDKSKQKKSIKKTGVFTGSFAINPLTKSEMPVWVSDFVIGDFGTGAVVGVPGHDKRDFEFAREFEIPVKRVVVDSSGSREKITKIDQVYEDDGIVINSGFLDQMDTEKARKKVIDWFIKEGIGVKETNYHLRDWLISRQRYWGPPIPMIYCKACANRGVSWFTSNLKNKTKGLHKVLAKEGWNSAGWYIEENLPVLLPEIKDYLPKGSGRGPLADHPEFYQTTCPECGGEAHRETDVLDTFLDSAWYFLAYPNLDTKEYRMSPNSEKAFFDRKIMKAWLPVDLYFGGAEHAVLHLMYARFITMFLHDLGLINFEEPFTRFYAHGLVIKDGSKMSKSKGNVVNPDEYITKYGADTLRLYLMFMGPMDGYPDFRDTGIEGMRRFVERIWETFVKFPAVVLSDEGQNEVNIKMHQTIKKVTSDIEQFKYNTAIASIMEYVNELRSKTKNSKQKEGVASKESIHALEVLAQLIAPFAPHIAEEIWTEKLGKSGSIHSSKWPEFDKKMAEESKVVVAVQVNGKTRATLILSKGLAQDKNHVYTAAKSLEKVAKHLKQHPPHREIFVPGKILNFVTNK